MAIYKAYNMRAWNTNLTEYVFWVVEGTPDFVGTYSGYSVSDLTNFSVVKTVDLLIPTYSNTTRPAATNFDAGVHIWNTDDNAPNFSDGTNWRDSQGNLT